MTDTADLIKATLADQVYTLLRADIISQAVPCGEKLTLKALQERFNISSTPVREAVNRLCQEGLVDHVTNVGARVVVLGPNDIREIYDFCAYLDLAALQLALNSGRVGELTAALNQCIEAQEKALTYNDLNGFLQQSDYFHRIFYQFAGNSRLTSAAKMIDGQFTLLSTLYQHSTLAKSVVLQEHRKIVEAILHQDHAAAVERMAGHFEHAKDYLLANLG